MPAKPIAMVLANQPDALALFFALSSLPVPVIALPADHRGWRSSPPLPAGTPIALTPRLASLAGEAERVGLAPIVLAEPRLEPDSAVRGPVFLTGPGVVVFTSGSTELPRPVYRTTEKLLSGAAAIVEAFRLPRGAGVVGALPIARGFGFVHALLVATLTSGTLGLLERYDPHAVFWLCGAGSYHYWPATPVMIDAFRRCPWPEPLPPLPPFYVVATRLSRSLREAFERRFGVPLRQTYGTTETGPVTLDRAPAAAVRSDTAGSPLDGVAITVGDDPEVPSPPGRQGRVWVRTPRYMNGYGFPPDLTRPDSQAGWWPTQDVGHLDGAGSLNLVGRLDECVRTASGYLVNPTEISGAVEEHPGVTDVAVVPLDTTSGPVLGVLVEGARGVTVESVHRHLNARLPLWSRPRIVEVIDALPRLPGGKVDRRECIRLLRALLDREPACD